MIVLKSGAAIWTLCNTAPSVASSVSIECPIAQTFASKLESRLSKFAAMFSYSATGVACVPLSHRFPST